jgi:hypothetical protein
MIKRPSNELHMVLFGHKVLSIQVPGHILKWFTAEEQRIKARMNDCSSTNGQDKHI